MAREVTADDVGFSEGEDCPLCLERLPPMWESFESGRTPCCGKRICRGCVEGKAKYLAKRCRTMRGCRDKTEWEQVLLLLHNCPLCRADLDGDNKETLLKKNSANGKGWADYALHLRYADRDARLSGRHLALSAERGFPPALHKIAHFHSTKDHPYDDIEFSRSKAMGTLWRASECGHAQARYEFALYLIEEIDGGLGKDGEGDVEKAIQIMNLAAAEGYAHAYFCLGNIYKHGQYGVEKDEMWEQWYFAKGAIAETKLLAAEQETEFDSMYQMGCISLNEEAEARRLGDEAASKGLDAYKSYKNAHLMFEKAAFRGHTPSQEKMAWMYVRMGPTRPKEFTIGISWAQIARNNGSQWAEEFLQDEKTQQPMCKICFKCSATAKGGESRFHKCGKCGIAHYCSKECQKTHWHEGHKNYCGTNTATSLKDKRLEQQLTVAERIDQMLNC